MRRGIKLRVKLLHYTPNYHKLVEVISRVCYQSYDKCSPESHKFLRGIMGKGHLSVASSGNIVFGILTDHDDEFSNVLLDLVTYKEINNYIRWSTYSEKNKKAKYDFVVSMNLLTLLDIVNNYKDYELTDEYLVEHFLDLLKDVPEIYWFIDNSVEAPKIDNPYIASPSLLNPVILSEDYTSLKDKLTPYELDIHATVTINWITDRATGLQSWRHSDMTGGCELSQRYVERGNAGLRIPEFESATLTIDQYEKELNQEVNNYIWFKDTLIEGGMRQGRAKEVARMLLPNATLTRIIQSRPLRQWKHFFELRDSAHAQLEIQQDTKAIKNAFINAGVQI